MLRKIYKFYRKYHYCINGAAVGLLTGILFVTLGIIKTVIILACVYAGYFVGKKLMADKEAVEHELDEKYQTLREEYQQEQAQIVSLEEARKNKPKYEE